MTQFLIQAILLALFSNWGSAQLHDSSQIIINKTLPTTTDDIIINKDPGGDLSREIIYPTKKEAASNFDKEQLTAQSALTIDAKSGLVLIDKNSKAKRSIASVTKLMTALVFLDEQLEHPAELAWDKTYAFSPDDVRAGRQYMGSGEQATIKDLFAFMLVGSVNSAAAALVGSTGLSEEEFVKKMNNKAQELKMTDTSFADPTGLSDDDISTARDLVKLVYQAMQQEDIVKMVSLPSYEFSPQNKKVKHKTLNTDKLLEGSWLSERKYQFIGGKTGYTETAGYNFVSQLKNDQGQEVISIILGASTVEDRFGETKAIIQWSFDNYQFGSSGL